MTIKQVNTGAHGRKPRYFIENEGGGTVAHFDSLCTAALVLRYLNGAPMTEEDADMAWDAMQAFDMRNEEKDIETIDQLYCGGCPHCGIGWMHKGKHSPV